MSKQTITIPLKPITFQKTHLLLITGVVIIACVLGTVYFTRAAFIQPDFAPGDSDQDFAQNILGANNADNDFDSSLVVASTTGSIIERLEYLQERVNIYPGAGFASTSLTITACESASDWEWFEDANGNGLEGDPEDGVCVKTTTRVSNNWGGTETNDNTYIMDYDCTGTFPNGTTTVAAANSCALCVADCYDGVKNLPDQGDYTSPDTSCDGSDELCYDGPITPEVLKNWTGTRLPTSLDFFGYCGSKGEDDGDSNYYTGCDASTTIGQYGGQAGRTDECIDLSDTSYEWLSEKLYHAGARQAGSSACSFVAYNGVNSGYRFRAVFRP